MVRSVAAGVHFDDTPPAEAARQRREYTELLGVLVTLAERLDARLYDPQREAFIARGDIETVAGALD